ncbi:MAG: hypothetical protein OEX09_06515 [Candidatus Bathyarchaeota archaeon]|nr:hypothetical protein [Candidatus Bathyarchaeota archaeon]
MSKADVGKRLIRLVSSSVCPAEDASQYGNEPRLLARKVPTSNQFTGGASFSKHYLMKKRLRILKLLEVREMCARTKNI